MVTWRITAAQRGQRLNKYLMRKLPEAQSSFLYRMLRKKNITLNSKKASGSELLEEGDLVTLFLSEETIRKFGGSVPSSGKACDSGAAQQGSDPSAAEETEEYLRAFRQLNKRIGARGILYEDGHVLFVCKPVGFLSQKASDADRSMNEWLIGYLLQSGACSAQSLTEFRPSVCNRLDRNTGGILLCAKTLQGARALTAMLRERTMRKFYRAVVVGRMRGKGEIEGLLTRDRKTNTVTFKSTPPKGKLNNTKTLYRTILEGDRFSLVEMELVTGRTHQLRSHMASVGHPIAGDAKYGDSAANSALQKEYGLRGQLLWCCRVEFPVLPPDAAPADEVTAALSGTVVYADPPALYEQIVLHSQ